jgi:acetyltransferase
LAALLSGYTVQAMAERPAALELIAGMHSDPVFGPVLLLGEGGVQVELSARHALALPPLDAELADELMARSGLLPLLAGYRGRPACDKAALVDGLLKLSALATDLDELAELDINPLLIDEHGILVVDARARLRPVDQAAVPPAILPYPAEPEETVDFQGQAMLIRPIRPSDGLALQTFYAQASPQDLRLRFFAARREVPLSELARYSQIDYDREMTFVAVRPGSDPAELCAEVRAVCDPDKRSAEFSLQVGSAWQGRRLGERLLRKMIEYLRSQGSSELMGLSLAENQTMLGLARRLGFAIEPSPGDASVVMRLALQPFRSTKA